MIRVFLMASVGAMLAGCSSLGLQGGQPSSLPPAPTTPVQSQSLEPLNPVINPVGQPNINQQPINNAMGAEAEGVSVPVQGAGNQPVGVNAGVIPVPSTARDISRTDLLGAWTLASGGEQCKLNMNLTNWTGGYRASSRGCRTPDLQGISAWNLDGKQVVLIGRDGIPVAKLFSSTATRYDGQLASDGRALSFFR